MMPHTRSAKKNLRKNEKRRLQNRSVKKAIKSEIKKAESLAASESLDALQAQCRLAIKKLDKAAAKRIVHPNLAARKKSQLAKLMHRKETARTSAS
jgi:small subunit ribosomal protein S20